MLLILAATVIGGLGTAAVTVSTSPLLAVVLAPIAGSTAALIAGLFLNWRRGRHWQSEADLEAQNDAMADSLNGSAEPQKALSPDQDASRGRRTAA
jgi:hypothetical protein